MSQKTVHKPVQQATRNSQKYTKIRNPNSLWQRWLRLPLNIRLYAALSTGVVVYLSDKYLKISESEQQSDKQPMKDAIDVSET